MMLRFQMEVMTNQCFLLLDPDTRRYVNRKWAWFTKKENRKWAWVSTPTESSNKNAPSLSADKPARFENNLFLEVTSSDRCWLALTTKTLHRKMIALLKHLLTKTIVKDAEFSLIWKCRLNPYSTQTRQLRNESRILLKKKKKSN